MPKSGSAQDSIQGLIPGPSRRTLTHVCTPERCHVMLAVIRSPVPIAARLRLLPVCTRIQAVYVRQIHLMKHYASLSPLGPKRLSVRAATNTKMTARARQVQSTGPWRKPFLGSRGQRHVQPSAEPLREAASASSPLLRAPRAVHTLPGAGSGGENTFRPDSHWQDHHHACKSCHV